MNEVVVMAGETSRHECWDHAIARVCTVAGIRRESVRLRSAADGVDVLNGHPEPFAWVTNPARYNAARSRGELEDLATFFSTPGRG